MKPKHHILSFGAFSRSIAVAGVTTLFSSPVSEAAIYYWDGNDATAGFDTASGTWAVPTTGTTTSGWSTDATGSTAISGNAVITTITDTTNFGNGATGLAAGPITVSGTVDTGNLIFASGSGAIVLSGGTLNMAAAETITVNNTSDTIGSIVTGAATSLTKAGTGKLILSSANTYAGATTVNAGTLQIDGSSTGTTGLNTTALLNIGNGTGNSGSVIIGSGAGILNFGGDAFGNAAQVAFNGGGTSSLTMTGGTVNIAGVGGIAAALNISVSTASAGTVTVNGGILNVGGRILMGANTTGANGTLTINSGATVNVGYNGSVGYTGSEPGCILMGNFTTKLDLNGGTLSLFAFQSGSGTARNINFNGTKLLLLGSPAFFFGNNGGTGSVATTNGTYTTTIKAGGAIFDTNGFSITVAPVLAHDATLGATPDGGLTKQGVGTLTLSASNTYIGGTAVKNGTLALGGGNDRIQTGTIVTLGDSVANTSGIFKLDSRSQQLGGLLTAGGGTGNRVVNGNATAATLTLNIVSGTNTFGGILGGAGTNENNFALTKSGNGILSLNSASSSFTGNINITGGTAVASGTTGGVNSTTGSLGNPQTASRTITVGNGTTLTFANNDILGNAGSTPVVKIIVNGGTINNSGNFFTAFGAVDLNAGTINSIGGANASFPSFQLGGTITVGGSAASIISASGTNSQMTLGIANGNNTSTTFNVADATSSSASDLNVSAVFQNGSGVVNGLIKTGLGTMTLSGTNTFTGLTNITAGTLAYGASNVIATGGVTVNGATAVLALGASLSDTVGTVTVDGGGSITGSSTLTSTVSFEMKSGTVSAILAGLNIAMNKTTPGTITLLSNASSFTGDLSITQGTIVAGGGVNGLNPATGTLGNPQTAGRKIIVGSGTFLTFDGYDVFGNFASTPLVTLEINGGTVQNNGAQFVTLGPVTLNGGTLTGTGGVNASFQTYQLRGDVSVSGSTASIISATGTNNGIHLKATTLFNVADVTVNATTDLTVSAPLINQASGVAGGLTKSGVGTMTLTGANTYSGSTTVSAGTLALVGGSQASPITLGSSGSLEFTLGSATTSTSTFDLSTGTIKITGTPTLATYTLIASSTGITGTPTLDAPIPGYALQVSGNALNLVKSGTPYSLWATAKGLTGAPGSSTDPAKDADPDGDGHNNLYEFAFDGDPLSGATDGKIVGKIATVGADQVLTLTLPVRTGAVFSGTTEQVSALIDAIIYHVQGAPDLATYTNVISEVTGGDAMTIQTGLPALSSGWTYRTFRTAGTVPTVPKDFLRAKIE